jgi:proton-translocating NADH-quinone oxidoreductase chain N
MTTTEFNIASASWFRPELVLSVGVLLLFLLDVGWKKSPHRVLILTLAVLACFGVAAGCLSFQHVESRAMFNGMIASDPFATFFKWLFLAAGVLTVLIAARATEFGPLRLGVFYALLLSIVLGMFLMASSLDLLMLYLAVEMVSLPSYAIAGYKPGDRRAAEASLKYVIYGGVASGIMLFGLSYIYGLTGTTSLLGLGARLDQLAMPAAAGGQAALRVALMVAVIFVLCGIGYKIAAVPWHMWCPDVYEGAPTPFTAFLSVGPKAAGFAMAIRVLYSSLASSAGAEGVARGLTDVPWPAVVGILAAVTMTLGNFTALHQNNLKRLLAYSSISHAGYALMGLSAASLLGVQSVMIYMLIYSGDEPGGLPRGHRHWTGHRLRNHRRLQGPGEAASFAGHHLRRLPVFAGRTAAAGGLHRQVVPVRGRAESLFRGGRRLVCGPGHRRGSQHRRVALLLHPHRARHVHRRARGRAGRASARSATRSCSAPSRPRCSCSVSGGRRSSSGPSPR